MFDICIVICYDNAKVKKKLRVDSFNTLFFRKHDAELKCILTSKAQLIVNLFNIKNTGYWMKKSL